MKRLLFVQFLIILCFLVPAFGQDDPDPNSPSPILISETASDRALAVDAGAFRGRLPLSGRSAFEPGPDRSFILFLRPLPLLPGEGANAFRVYLKQSNGRTFELGSEEIIPTSRDFIALRVRLFDAARFRGQPTASGDSWLYVTWRGLASNILKFGIGSTGGKIGAKPVVEGSIADLAPEYVGYRWSGDRSRFLEQATFGPSTVTDQRLRRIGIRSWLTEQFDAPYPYIPLPNPPQMPTSPPSDCQLATNQSCYRDRYTLMPLQQWFFKEAFYGNAQLRHRTAWALSQILVTSGITTTQSSHAIAYHKILQENAFGSYKELLSDVTLSPTMGNYLDMVRSTKVNPNENYPREILQLFSIGLFMLNPDGTQILDSQGNPIPTFDQNVINNLSRVFTGWTYCNTSGCPNAVPGVVNYKDPMILIPGNHDTGTKTLLTYPGAVNNVIPACSNCTDDSRTALYAEASLQQAINNIFNHPNVGPYIGKLMIQHMVMSAPSPAYVARVAAAFADNGSGVRGDMKAVIRAVLLDPEARGDIKTAPRYGKLREPVQLVTNLARIFPAVAFNSGGNSDGGLAPFTTPMGQNPFYSPTVFNYFLPDHVVPGTTIIAPEFEIFNSGTAVKRTNFLYIFTFEGIGPNATDSLRGTALDYSEFVPLAQGDPTANQLLDALNAKMMHGTLSPAHRSLILSAVAVVPSTDPLLRVKTAVYLIACSSQFQIQK